MARHSCFIHTSCRIEVLLVCVWLVINSKVNTTAVREQATTAAEPRKTVSREYCLGSDSEAFDARCLKSEVILMNNAIYGRMRIGRCLRGEDHIFTAFGSNPNVFGCSVDVIHLLDRKCSGKNHCELRGTDDDLQHEKPCLKGFNSYLEADYDCVTVIEEDRNCLVSVSFIPLHIMRSSSSSSKLGCGTRSQPWRLEAPAGQQINVSLIDFIERRNDSIITRICHPQYGYVLDRSAQNNISLCQSNDRIQSVHKSSSNIVEIILTADSMAHSNVEQPTFLIRFFAVGCSNLVPPEDMWLRRNNNEAVVGCYSSRQTWHLRCTGNNWTGAIGTCTREVVQEAAFVGQSVVESSVASQQIIVIVAIACTGVALCLIVICCGVVCWKRYRAEYKNIIKNSPGVENRKYWQATVATELLNCAT